MSCGQLRPAVCCLCTTYRPHVAQATPTQQSFHPWMERFSNSFPIHSCSVVPVPSQQVPVPCCHEEGWHFLGKARPAEQARRKMGQSRVISGNEAGGCLPCIAWLPRKGCSET